MKQSTMLGFMRKRAACFEVEKEETPQKKKAGYQGSTLPRHSEEDTETSAGEQEEISNTETNEVKWPSVWTKKQVADNREKYEWLISNNQKLGCSACQNAKSLNLWKEQGMSISREWSSCSISTGNDEQDREKVLSCLRGKIKKHNDSKAHKIAQEIEINRRKKILESAINTQNSEHITKTEAVFRSVYYMAKSNRPFTDHEGLVELQKLNGVDMGFILHSRFSAVNIVRVIAEEMRKRIVEKIISSKAKLAVLIDEASTSSMKSTMTVHLRVSFKIDEKISEPEFVFLALCELESQTAEGISTSLLTVLLDAGFTEEYLKENWIAFVSDGASVLMGKRSGVAVRLQEKFPTLLIWHCLNHRLELAVHDAIGEINAVNHFKIFMDSLYCVYSQSSKNQRQLQEISEELNTQCLKIGRILDVRWVSSSYRTVVAVYKSHEALCKHFQRCSVDETRHSRERQKFLGLFKRLCSIGFLSDLAVMHDTLHELSMLSLELQKRSMTLTLADRLIKRCIRVLISLKDQPGEKETEIHEAAKSGCFNSIMLQENEKIRQINRNQFIQSLVNNMERRLASNADSTKSFLADTEIFDKNQWPNDVSIRFGEVEIRRLSTRLMLDSDTSVRGMRAFVDGENDPEDLRPLQIAISTIPFSSAQCERDFSLMNIICTDLRSNLLVSNISHLMMISINGPPLNRWQPRDYVKKWLLQHRSASDTKSRKVSQSVTSEKTVWKIL